MRIHGKPFSIRPRTRCDGMNQRRESQRGVDSSADPPSEAFCVQLPLGLDTVLGSNIARRVEEEPPCMTALFHDEHRELEMCQICGVDIAHIRVLEP